ncbi:MAG: EGF domain-containing protein, partial [Pseudomonadota bacterium]
LATCTNLPGGYECDCLAGYEGDGVSCTDIDECQQTPYPCDPFALCTNTGGSFGCTCPTGFVDQSGDGKACVAGGYGQIVLVGHDFSQASTATGTMIGNAVFMANTPTEATTVEVLAYTEYADTTVSGQVDDTNAAIAARATAIGRTWNRTSLTSSGGLAAAISGKHVLLIYEQETADQATLTAIGTAWSGTLPSFVRSGGMVVVCDKNGGLHGTWQILASAGLLAVNGSASVVQGTELNVVDSLDPVAARVGESYLATANTASFSFGATDGQIVVETSGDAAVVVRKEVPRPPGHMVLIGHDFSNRSTDEDKIIGNSVLLANTTGTVQVLGYTQYSTATKITNSKAAIGARAGALGRSATITDLANYTQLATLLADKHVFLIYEQSLAAPFATISSAWAATLDAFVDRGGVIVLCDATSNATYKLVSGLITVSGSSQLLPAPPTNQGVVLVPTDPVVKDVASPFTPTTFSGGFTTSEATVVVKSSYSNQSMVIHKTFTD